MLLILTAYTVILPPASSANPAIICLWACVLSVLVVGARCVEIQTHSNVSLVMFVTTMIINFVSYALQQCLNVLNAIQMPLASSAHPDFM